MMNNGDSTISVATITYFFSGEQKQTYNWTGNLLSGDSILVLLPSILSEKYGKQELTIQISTGSDSLDYDIHNNRNKESE